MSISDIYYNGILGTFMQNNALQFGLFAVLYIGGYLICMAAGYFLGSINSAIIISRLKYGGDIRTSGSGNAGMTNVLRTYGKAPAAMTFGGDALKTFVSFLIGTLIFGRCGAYFSCFMCVIGHIFPVYYRFKGGKGIVCACIAILLLNPFAFVVLLIIFTIVFLGFRYVSLASIMSAMVYPIAHKWSGQGDVWPMSTILAVLIAVIVLWRHYPNMKRLLARTEPKIDLSGLFSKKKKKEKEAEKTEKAVTTEKVEGGDE